MPNEFLKIICSGDVITKATRARVTRSWERCGTQSPQAKLQSRRATWTAKGKWRGRSRRSAASRRRRERPFARLRRAAASASCVHHGELSTRCFWTRCPISGSPVVSSCFVYAEFVWNSYKTILCGPLNYTSPAWASLDIILKNILKTKIRRRYLKKRKCHRKFALINNSI